MLRVLILSKEIIVIAEDGDVSLDGRTKHGGLKFAVHHRGFGDDSDKQNQLRIQDPIAKPRPSHGKMYRIWQWRL